MRRPQLRRAAAPLAALLLALLPAAAVAAVPGAFGESAAAGESDADAATLPRCGLGKDFHAGRRRALVEALRAEGEGGLLIVRGRPTTRDYERFHQDKNFWYLTGVSSPDAALLVELDTGREVLFLPRVPPHLEIWEGEVWDAQDAWVEEVAGFGEVRPTNGLLALARKLHGGGPVWITLDPWIGLGGCYDRALPYERERAKDTLDGRVGDGPALKAALEAELDAQVRDCRPFLHELRRVKQPAEIAALRRASEVGAAAMAEAIRSTRPGLREHDLEGLMTWQHRRGGAEGPAYMAIVGSGPNSLVLHYSAVERELRGGEVVLVDYAPQVDHYCSDITRTWPTDGAFTPRMAELYDAVLAAQEAGIAAVRPGARIADVERACRRVLAERGLESLIRHGSCHLIGLEVHDVGEASRPLVPGVAFTVEPGLYEPATGIGIRIEDVVVVTEEGCEVLSAGVPKARAAVAALVGEEGVLDREAAFAPLAAPAAAGPQR